MPEKMDGMGAMKLKFNTIEQLVLFALGVAGCYLAWRLSKMWMASQLTDADFNILLFATFNLLHQEIRWNTLRRAFERSIITAIVEK